MAIRLRFKRLTRHRTTPQRVKRHTQRRTMKRKIGVMTSANHQVALFQPAPGVISNQLEIRDHSCEANRNTGKHEMARSPSSMVVELLSRIVSTMIASMAGRSFSLTNLPSESSRKTFRRAG